ncbi:uncharacterized protein LOC135207765 [Macrobrachium nipponense]|uniref:uncharacterized protein LOC135207765 n=1 Tax=Macrobrachium nipponense TaxID=159736 RepID=UPI0030C7BB24
MSCDLSHDKSNMQCSGGLSSSGCHEELLHTRSGFSDAHLMASTQDLGSHGHPETLAVRRDRRLQGGAEPSPHRRLPHQQQCLPSPENHHYHSYPQEENRGDFHALPQTSSSLSANTSVSYPQMSHHFLYPVNNQSDNNGVLAECASYSGNVLYQCDISYHDVTGSGYDVGQDVINVGVGVGGGRDWRWAGQNEVASHTNEIRSKRPFGSYQNTIHESAVNDNGVLLLGAGQDLYDNGMAAASSSADSSRRVADDNCGVTERTQNDVRRQCGMLGNAPDVQLPVMTLEIEKWFMGLFVSEDDEDDDDDEDKIDRKQPRRGKDNKKTQNDAPDYDLYEDASNAQKQPNYVNDDEQLI